METVSTIITTFLSVLLQLLELFVGFVIGALTLILDFARTVFGLVG
jgi:hypothetical protein